MRRKLTPEEEAAYADLAAAAAKLLEAQRRAKARRQKQQPVHGSVKQSSSAPRGELASEAIS